MNSALIGMVAALAYLAGAVLVFVFGSSYFSLFRTNKSWLFKLSLVAASGIATRLLARCGAGPALGLLAFAFLGASTASLLGAAAAHVLYKPLGLDGDDVKAMGLAKGTEALAVAGGILVLMALLGISPQALYLRPGNLGLGLALGWAGFLLFSVGAWIQGRQLGIRWRTYRRLLPWVLLFVFANGFMEELWFRGLFLGPMIALAGPVAAILLTAAVFALSHIGASYMAREDRLRFLLILFPIGIACAALFHFTGSILGAMLLHAGADLMAINGFIAAYHGPKERQQRTS